MSDDNEPVTTVTVTSEREEANALLSDFARRVVELAQRVDRLKQERDEARAKSDRFRAALTEWNDKTEWVQNIIRFCARGGVVSSPLRGE